MWHWDRKACSVAHQQSRRGGRLAHLRRHHLHQLFLLGYVLGSEPDGGANDFAPAQSRKMNLMSWSLQALRMTHSLISIMMSGQEAEAEVSTEQWVETLRGGVASLS
jgi:hypothetical protein